MDTYLSILKQCAEDPLIETIVELEQQLKDTVNTARIHTADFDALLAAASKSAVPISETG